MNANDDRHENGRLEAVFRSLDGEAAPPDEEFLSRLRERSTEVFAAAATQRTEHLSRRRSMFVLTARVLTATTAVAIGLAAWLLAPFSQDASAVTLGDVFSKMAAADTLQLKITRDGADSQVWTKGTRLRWDQPDGTYQIARDER